MDGPEEQKCFHRIFLTAATREKRHDIVDVMLHMIKPLTANNKELHRILTYSEPDHEDDTFREAIQSWGHRR